MADKPVILNEPTVVLIYQVPGRSILGKAFLVIGNGDLALLLYFIAQPQGIFQGFVERAVCWPPEGHFPSLDDLFYSTCVLHLVQDHMDQFPYDPAVYTFKNVFVGKLVQW